MSNNILFQAVCENYNDIINLTSPPARNYARKYQFDYSLDVKPHRFYKRCNAWNKIFKIRDYFKDGYDWVFCIDGDLLIYKFDKDIFDYVKSGKSIIFCSDGAGDNLYNFNTGAMLLKNNEVSNFLIDNTINTQKEIYFNKRQWEQNAMQEIVKDNEDLFQEHIQICGSNDFNHDSVWVFHPADKFNKQEKIDCLREKLNSLNEFPSC